MRMTLATIAVRRHLYNRHWFISANLRERKLTQHFDKDVKKMGDAVDKYEKEDKMHKITLMIPILKGYITEFVEARESGFHLSERLLLEEDKNLNSRLNEFLKKLKEILKVIKKELEKHKSKATAKEVLEVRDLLIYMRNLIVSIQNDAYKHMKAVYVLLLEVLKDAQKAADEKGRGVEGLKARFEELKKVEKPGFIDYVAMRIHERDQLKINDKISKEEADTYDNLAKGFEKFKKDKFNYKEFTKMMKELRKEFLEIVKNAAKVHRDTYKLLKRIAYFELMAVHFTKTLEFDVIKDEDLRYIPLERGDEFLNQITGEMNKEVQVIDTELQNIRIVERDIIAVEGALK